MGLNSFDKLIEPYKQGGTEKGPVDVTIGNICSKLMVNYRIPPEIVGSALYNVFNAIANKGLVFKGNRKWGSKGAELFSCIKAQCVDMTEKKSAQDAINAIMATTSCMRNCPVRSKVLVKTSRWQRFKMSFVLIWAGLRWRI